MALLYDGERGDRNVQLCRACLSRLQEHAEERAFLSIVHFGRPRFKHRLW